jgi:hypothetical protein
VKELAGRQPLGNGRGEGAGPPRATPLPTLYACDRGRRPPEAAWSPRTALPEAPAAFTTEIRDSGDTPPPLTLTVVASRKEKEPWF